ncbi:LPXTG cell wall anchor domain-containing protein [Pseudogracilibacillus sp. SO30301A]|uniref:LPXTG cell wall anchor domain-containing protein n=1 Tax=Pseudogracilibacillus sp. SO30301A TaxID=3098291 RepID=UPI00300E14B8
MEEPERNKKVLLQRSIFIIITLILLCSPIFSTSLGIHKNVIHAESAPNIEQLDLGEEEMNTEGDDITKQNDTNENEQEQPLPIVIKSDLASFLQEVQAENLNESDYTEESWNRFMQAVNNAENILTDEDASQIQVDSALINLNFARNGLLIPIPPIGIIPIVDKDGLEDYLNQMKELNSTLYTTDSWARLEAAMEEAEAVLENEDATQLEIHRAYTNLYSAFQALEELFTTIPITADKSELATYLQELDGKELTEKDYTDETWSKFVSALTTAELVMAYKYATQEQVDNALDALKNAYEGLIRDLPIRPPVEPFPDKSELKNLLDDVYEESLDSDLYTADSWEPFQQALTNAEKVYSSNLITQQDVDEAVEVLTDAYNGLELIPQEDPKEPPRKPKTPKEPEPPKDLEEPKVADVDKTKLQEYVNEIKAKELDDNSYTENSWQSFENSLAHAENVLETEDATQEDVDQALEHLKEAYENLEHIEKNSENNQEEESETFGEAGSESSGGDGNLPNTATNSWNYVLGGILSILIGLGVYTAIRFRKAI